MVARDPTIWTDGRTPSQIGEALWRARSRMDLSLEDIARVTKIGVPTLRTIEESDFERMPPGHVTAAAVSAYASAVGLPRKWAVRT
ncbi:MAG: helix-turn-helix domain-containing protein [Sphingomonas sp.]|uniref:helix-turn-helix domain-containing protein n=1 Tax=Sphingomonas sp. TaxID=28214 RepID=UPI003F817A94